MPDLRTEGDRARTSECAARHVILLRWFGVILAGAVVLVVLYLFSPTQYPLYPRCMFNVITGLDCPGCGALRATHRLLHGDVAGAFRFNPLLLILLPFIGLNCVAQLVRQLTGRRLFGVFRHPFWIWLLLGAVVVFWVARNLPFGPLARYRI